MSPLSQALADYPLSQALADYLRLRRALGFKLERAEKLLAQFVAYLHDHHADAPTIDHALAWATLPAEAAPRWWAYRLSTVRGFAAHLHALDPRVEVPPPGLIRCGPRRATPYQYSQADLTALVAAAGTLPRRVGAATYQTLLGLLAVTGMRVGEAIGLDRDDLDADHDGLLRVRNGKFGKSRQLPLHPSTLAALRAYLQVCDELLPTPTSPALLLSTVGTRLRYNSVWRTFHRLVRQAGLTTRSPSCQPRLHDLRHSFAVRTLLDWYARGADVQALLPRLSTYLGHTDPKHTYWYLSAAPELLALAQQRVDVHRAGRP
jgi:integrase/recombinase XerD